MNASNPFQVPACFQRTDVQRRQRKIKQMVIAIIACVGLMLIGLLIEGCQSERTSAKAVFPAGAVPVAAESPAPAVPTAPKTGIIASPDVRPVVPQSAPVVSKANAAAHAELIYEVKSGDTLTRIARSHGLTVKAVKAANGLVNDRIGVGARLKLPVA